MDIIVLENQKIGSETVGEQQQIIYMQIRIVRLASERWNMAIEDIVEMFSRYQVFSYIEECFGIFHVEGDEAILEDVIGYMRNKGAVIHGRVE